MARIFRQATLLGRASLCVVRLRGKEGVGGRCRIATTRMVCDAPHHDPTNHGLPPAKLTLVFELAACSIPGSFCLALFLDYAGGWGQAGLAEWRQSARALISLDGSQSKRTHRHRGWLGMTIVIFRWNSGPVSVMVGQR